MFVIASDHGGFELKEAIREMLKKQNFECQDMGTLDLDSVDYPDYGEKVASAVSSGEAEAGILVCGTGIGMSIVANKFPGVRAALAHDSFTAKMSKEHNNANVLVLGGRILSVAEGVELAKLWLETEFEGGRHQQRLDKISRLEKELSC